jgi:hypothetical protein
MTQIAALKAASAYFALLFGLGFVLGTLRVLLIVPVLGELPAVLLELPVMLTASWFACRWLVQRFAVPADVASRLIMGGVAFALLMAAEAGVSMLLMGRTLAQHWATYDSLPALAGLLAQMLFAAFPLFQRR